MLLHTEKGSEKGSTVLINEQLSLSSAAKPCRERETERQGGGESAAACAWRSQPYITLPASCRRRATPPLRFCAWKGRKIYEKPSTCRLPCRLPPHPLFTRRLSSCPCASRLSRVQVSGWVTECRRSLIPLWSKVCFSYFQVETTFEWLIFVVGLALFASSGRLFFVELGCA